ncbi:ubiquitin carrier protein [Diplodia corticola]|uniref:Ubiquitin carrier protein n=1 Tax=Diplodia corticola TaxID=236234 RepID=A0A1J9R6R1_9PEZI|nr:ubiquitin carrier protein [Diplodia corticola]OJD36280.1 ubiquitin carrier protein [Diplodia corticola]
MGFPERLLDPLLKRGMDIASNLVNKHYAKAVEKREAGGSDDDLETGVLITVGLTLFVFVVFYGLVQYTLRHVVTTLALVETPATAVQLSAAPSDEESNVKLSDKEAEAEAFLGGSLPKLTVVNAKPVTSKIRTTIKHITSQAGWTARWRGMGYGFIYSLAFYTSVQFLAAITPSLPGLNIIVILLATVIAAPAHMIWTHATIALPGTSWRTRWTPAKGLACYKNLAVPALVYEGVQILVAYMTVCMGTLLSLDVSASADATPSQKAWTVVRLIGGVLLLAAAGIFVILPAHTQLVRVEASMLSEDEDTIVPFDRTFGGKVVPKVLGGSGAIGFMDAWRSFNREARIRVVKLYLKIFAISVTLFLLFVHVIGLEVLLLSKHSVGDVVNAAQHQAL